jgi:DNA polymerase elongation subunit (family B)
MTGPRILALDIETAPHTAHVWGLFKQNVGLNQIMETGRVLCVAWKWLGDKGKVEYVSELEGRGIMLDKVHELLNQADIVVSYNGKKFDIPTLNKEFLEGGYAPPSPYKQVDLYSVARGRFRFASNKMDHLARQLGLKTKLRHSGHDLWVRCMAGDRKAWLKMERYNKRDVLILDKLYYRMLPWITNHPNVTLYTNAGARRVCPSCGSHKLQSRGLAVTKALTYTRYQCVSCGSWSRERLRATPGATTPKVVSYA